VKWYLKQEWLLDATTSDVLDYYLVMTGPTGGVASAKGGVRPWLIESVYTFDAHSLLEQLQDKSVNLGIATSISSGSVENLNPSTRCGCRQNLRHNIAIRSWLTLMPRCRPSQSASRRADQRVTP